MENYTIPLEKAVDLMPVSSQLVRLFSPVVFPCSGTRSFPIQYTELRPQDTFTNAQALWSFVGGYGVYGGSTVAHCLVAAQKTIPSDYVAHSLYCSFVPLETEKVIFVACHLPPPGLHESIVLTFITYLKAMMFLARSLSNSVPMTIR